MTRGARCQCAGERAILVILTADWVTLLDLGTLLHTHLDHNARHGRTDRARIIRGPFTRYRLDS